MNLRGMLLGSLLGLTSCATNDYNNHNSSYNPNQHNGGTSYVQDKKDSISIERIEELMKRGSVDEILKEEYKNGTIEHLVYDYKNPEESAKKYKEFVFQENLDSKDRKPVLVMFYRKVKGDTTGAAERESIILKEIEKIYGDKINSLAFLVPMENKETGAPYEQPLKDLIGVWIRGAPSIALYGQYDLLKGETEEKNNGKIKHLDTLYKGPLENKTILTGIIGCRDYWINPNAFSIASPNGKIGRFNNEGELKVIDYKLNGKPTNKE